MGSHHEYELPQRGDAKARDGAGCIRDGGTAVVVLCRIRNRGSGSAAGAMERGYLDPQKPHRRLGRAAHRSARARHRYRSQAVALRARELRAAVSEKTVSTAQRLTTGPTLT